VHEGNGKKGMYPEDIADPAIYFTLRIVPGIYFFD